MNWGMQESESTHAAASAALTTKRDKLLELRATAGIKKCAFA